MVHSYESEILQQLMEREGFNIPSSVPPYEAEIKDYFINQVKLSYPKITDYEAEWLIYNLTEHLPAEFPIVSVSNVTNAYFENVVPSDYKEVILKGNTKYRDIETGDILDTFDESKNLEIVSVKMPVLTTTGKNFCSVSNIVFMPESTSSWYFANGVKQTLFGSKLKRSSDCEWFYLPYGVYTFSYGDGTSRGFQLIAEYEKYNYGITNNNSRTISEGWYTVRVKSGSSLEQIRLVNLQIEKGTKPTSYEPYKSNILTVNEDVTLRSNADICDELNLLTGQLTQRIGEDGVVLSQEVIKTVDLKCINENGENVYFRPLEGVMNVSTTSETIKPTFNMTVPVEAITQNLSSFIDTGVNHE